MLDIGVHIVPSCEAPSGMGDPGTHRTVKQIFLTFQGALAIRSGNLDTLDIGQLTLGSGLRRLNDAPAVASFKAFA